MLYPGLVWPLTVKLSRCNLCCPFNVLWPCQYDYVCKYPKSESFMTHMHSKLGHLRCMTRQYPKRNLFLIIALVVLVRSEMIWSMKKEKLVCQNWGLILIFGELFPYLKSLIYWSASCKQIQANKGGSPELRINPQFWRTHQKALWVEFIIHYLREKTHKK